MLKFIYVNLLASCFLQLVIAQPTFDNQNKGNNSMTTLIHTPTNDLNNSLEFYKKLNFELISKENQTIVTDGKAIIEINPDRTARAGLKIFKKSWIDEIEKLEELTDIIEIESGFLLSDPNGVKVYLIEGKPKFNHTKSDKSFGLTGNYQGLNIETTNMKQTVQFWETIGFSIITGSEGTGFILIGSSDGFIIAVMKILTCPHLFINPSMSFFNGKNNVNVIQSIRELNIPVVEEITHFNENGIADNIIIRDPGGYGFFLFIYEPQF